MTTVRVDSEMSEELEAKVWMHQGSMHLPLLLTVAVDDATKLAKEIVLSKLMYADGLVLMSETIEGSREKCRKRRRLLKVNFGKIKVMGQQQHYRGWVI